jgi:hypothetical protein
MFCPSGVNSGLIEIVGPIQQTDLQQITVSHAPLSISFAPRSTAPTLSGSRIIESAPTDNSCRYKGKKYVLSDIQVASSMHKGFVLPGMTVEPMAELIISFHSTSATNDLNDMSGILLCLPIYGSSESSHAEYVTQFLNITDPSDPASVNPPTIQSLFYKDPSDVTQTSFGYKTCFETGHSNSVDTHSIFVIIFPNGIRMPLKYIEQIRSKVGGSFSAYKFPVSIRGPEPTVLSYQTTNNGTKRADKFSDDGVPYTSPVSSCSEEFKRIEYFPHPPQLDASVNNINKNKKLYKKTQYKCVPFDQLRDVSGEYVKLGNKSLSTILAEQKEVQDAQESSSDPKANSNSTLSTGELELGGEIVGTCVAIAMIGFFVYKMWEWKNQD